MPNTFFEELQQRGFINQCSDMDTVHELLDHDKIAVYLGSDPTADSLHVGHLVPIMMMRWLQKYGHKPIMLVGGATGRIGDPSGRDTSRPMMTEETLAKNIAGLKKSYSKFLHFGDGASDAIIVDNYDWMRGYTHLDFLAQYGLDFTIPRMLSMESVKKRLENGMSFLEFNYMTFQAVDFLTLYRKYNCVLQLCGADQWGNAIMGVELVRKKCGKEVYVLSTALLTDSNGNKIGKSAGNAVWVNEDKTSAYDYYQYFRNIGDTEVGKCLRIFTELPMDEVRRLEALKDKEINEAKKILAFEATKLCRGEEAAKAAAETARRTFEEGIAGGDLPTLAFTGDIALTEALVQLKLTASKGEAKRLIAQSGVKVNDAVVSGDNIVLTAADMQNGQIKLSVGKKKHGLIK